MIEKRKLVLMNCRTRPRTQTRVNDARARFDAWLSDLAHVWGIGRFPGMRLLGGINSLTNSERWNENSRTVQEDLQVVEKVFDVTSDGFQAHHLLEMFDSTDSGHDDRIVGQHYFSPLESSLSRDDISPVLTWLVGAMGFQVDGTSHFVHERFPTSVKKVLRFHSFDVSDLPQVDLDLTSAASRHALAGRYWATHGAGRLLHGQSPADLIRKVDKQIREDGAISFRRVKTQSDYAELAAMMQIAELLGYEIADPMRVGMNRMSVPVTGVNIKVAGPERAAAVTQVLSMQAPVTPQPGWSY